MREDAGETLPVDDVASATTPDGIPLFANGRRLSDQDIAALREARDRRALGFGQVTEAPEQGGSGRLPPTRYGDWEKAGRAIDFS